MRYHEIMEDPALRTIRPEVVEWIEAARARPDADRLYVHGSNHQFDRFHDPNTDHGQLIFASKLLGWNEPRGHALQAEYYGRNLYLVRFNHTRLFSPYRDPEARAIYAEAIQGQWDYEDKIKYGHLDYQDTYLFVPPAVAAGYNFFRIYEIAMRGDSFGAAYADMVEIVDRFS